MHLIRRLSCQKSERIPLVAARCVLSERAAERTPESRILWLSAFVPADKDSVMILPALKNNALCNTVLYELIVNATPEKVLCHLIAVRIFLWQEQHFRLVLFHGRGRRLPVAHIPREGLHGFHEAKLPHFHQIIKGGIATNAP